MRFLFLIVFNFNSFGYDIYDHIIQIKPSIDKEYAKDIAKHVKDTVLLYDIDPETYVAILAQETMFRLDAIGHYKKKPIDFGIAQINKYHIKRGYKFDKERLLNDLQYSVNAGGIVLSYFKERYSKKEKYWWTRYNCGTKRSINRKTCKQYKKRVLKYFYKRSKK